MAAQDTSPSRSPELAERHPSPAASPDFVRATASGARRALGTDLGVDSAGADRAPALPLPFAANSSADLVLAAPEFEAFLARERDLADRGTRAFTVMVLRDRDVEARALPEFARKLRERLRSTDLVGRWSADQVALLLSDTDLAGAQVVGDWIDRCAADNGIQLDAMIYAYPSVEEALHADEPHENGRDGTDGPPNGHGSAHGNGAKHDVSPVRGPDALLEDRAPAHARWPMADLWTELSHPIPLWKRTLDIAGSAAALVALSPLLLAVAVAIKLDSPGPVIFRQTRAGRGARPFDFYKFRSMHVDAEKRRAELLSRNEQEGPIFKIRNDPRVTRVGRILRRWSIDELPQLWNILKGDLSLVGPRSPTFDEVAKYERWQRRRLNVTGGVTCFWQVSGRSQIGFRDWMRLDMRYLRRHGLWTDLCLLAKTLPAVLSCRGAY